MKLAIASDHAGFELKTALCEYLKQAGITFEDLGVHSAERADYPNYAEKVARAVSAGQFERGVLVCGTGIGMSVAANKVHGIRCAVCSEPYSAVLSRQHNNANILALGGRVVGPGLAIMILEQWLAAEFEGGRHQTRLDLITKIEEA